jgi:7-cyano-7-deazaguanine reductase
MKGNFCGPGVWSRINFLQLVGSGLRNACCSAIKQNESSRPLFARHAGLTQLGGHAAIPASPGQAVLERVPNPHPGALYLARFTAPEFTSICPVTGQPDFAHLVIDYALLRTGSWSRKSLKLYPAPFRNHGAFHEDCTIAMSASGMVDAIAPHLAAHRWLLVSARRHPIDVFWQTGKAP